MLEETHAEPGRLYNDFLAEPQAVTWPAFRIEVERNDSLAIGGCDLERMRYAGKKEQNNGPGWFLVIEFWHSPSVTTGRIDLLSLQSYSSRTAPEDCLYLSIQPGEVP